MALVGPSMDALEIPVADVGSAALDEFLSLDGFLRSDRLPPDSMLLSDLDGFLTGIAVGPERVPPREWLPIVWGGERPVFEDGREELAVLGAIASRYNEILRQVTDGTFQPILWTLADDSVTAADWVAGFVRAMELRTEAWTPLLESTHHWPLLLPILAFCADRDGDSLLGFSAEAEAEIMAEAPWALSACVMEIDEFWRLRRVAQSEALRVDRVWRGARLAPKIGPNDPCPCGSGRKSKRCCGRDS